MTDGIPGRGANKQVNGDINARRKAVGETILADRRSLEVV